MAVKLRFARAKFDPASTPGGLLDDDDGIVTFQAPDSPPYVYNDEIILAVNLALTTERPLFIAGPPGSGKTTLAASIARVLGAYYYEKIVTSRLHARDLLWTYDTLRRLSDAQVEGALKPQVAYLNPEVLWWAMDPTSAVTRGARSADRALVTPAEDPFLIEGAEDAPAVVLLDEIDKAEPDVPNDLLDPLDRLQFVVHELDHRPDVRKNRSSVHLVLTTNGEREMPPAFLRRCVVLRLPDPEPSWLVKVANRRFGTDDVDRHLRLASLIDELKGRARSAGIREPSTAEYLDAVVACRDLGIEPDSKTWRRMADALLWKHETEPVDHQTDFSPENESK